MHSWLVSASVPGMMRPNRPQFPADVQIFELEGTASTMIRAIVAVIVLFALRFWGIYLLETGAPVPYGDFIIQALGVLFAVAVAYLIDRVIRVLYWDLYHRKTRKRNIPSLIEDIFTAAALTLGACVGLYYEVGISATGLFTASGATAIIIGIALQTVIQDLFSGLSVNLDSSCTIGDRITVYMTEMEDTFYGEVIGIGWRCTYLRLPDGALLTVPNRILTSNWMVNHSRPPGPKRHTVDIAIDPHIPVDRALAILLEAAHKAVRAPAIAQNPEPKAEIKEITPLATVYEVSFYADPNKTKPETARAIMYSQVQRALNRFQLLPTATNMESSSARKSDAAWNDEQIRETLRQTPYFENVLEEHQLDSLVLNSTPRDFPPDELFIRQGDEGDSMFVLLEGVARVSVQGSGGEYRQVAILTGGDIVGEMSLMLGVPRTASVTSATHLRALEITKGAISALLDDSPQILERFSEVLSKRQEQLGAIANEKTNRGNAQYALLTRLRAYFIPFHTQHASSEKL
nr:MAG: mechanosensitive ion channel [Hyphomicrobiales bacterium]